MEQKDNILYALKPRKKKQHSRIIVSKTSNHITGDFTVFDSYSLGQNNFTIWIAYGTISKIMDKCFVSISQNITLNLIVYVSKLDCNLLSISKLTKYLKCVIAFSPNMYDCHILESGIMIGNAKEYVGLYIL